MTTRVRYLTPAIPVCLGARSGPMPPTGDGADVSSWTRATGDADAVEMVELTVIAGADVELSGALLVSAETFDTYPEESADVTVTNATETVNYTAHGFYTGDGPVRVSGSPLPTGYDGDAEYYAIRTGADTLKLAASRADALAGTAVAVSDDGTSVKIHWITGQKSSSTAASSVSSSVGEDWFAFAAPHGIATGTRVQVANAGGGLPTGLAEDTDYYGIAQSATHLQFATTAQNAADGVAIDLTTNGTGTQSVIADQRGATEATVYPVLAALNEGDPFDLTGSGVTYRERFEFRPGVDALHLAWESDSPVPITAYVRAIATIYDD